MLKGELLVYAGIRRSSVVRPSVVNIFKRLLLGSREADSFHISHMTSLGRGYKLLCVLFQLDNISDCYVNLYFP